MISMYVCIYIIYNFVVFLKVVTPSRKQFFVAKFDLMKHKDPGSKRILLAAVLVRDWSKDSPVLLCLLVVQ